MLFSKNKIDRLINVEETQNKLREQGKAELEKNDVLAIILAAIRVFLPILLLFIAVIWGMSTLFWHSA